MKRWPDYYEAKIKQRRILYRIRTCAHARVRVSRVRSFARRADAMERIPINYAQWRASNSMDCKLGLRLRRTLRNGVDIASSKPVCERLVFRRRCGYAGGSFVSARFTGRIEERFDERVFPIEYRYMYRYVEYGRIETAGRIIKTRFDSFFLFLIKLSRYG